MSALSDNYKKIISELENKLTNKEDLEFVKEKMSELSIIFINAIDNIAEKADKKIKKIEQKQKLIESKMEEVEKSVNEIESDIYIENEDEEEYDFEIVCPYCNNEFTEEINGKEEIICPECKNTIELDWNANENEEGCNGHCSTCGGCQDYEDEDTLQDNEEDEDM